MDSKRTVTKGSTKGSHDLLNTRKLGKREGRDEYEKMFEVKKEDNGATREIKQLRESLQRKTAEDLELEDFYFQQIAYLRGSKVKNLETLVEFWSRGHMSFSERIALMQECIDHPDPEEYLSALCQQQAEVFERGG